MFGFALKGPTPTQKVLGDILNNDAVHVLSSFELNRIASLTYGDDVCEEIFEMLEEIQRNPMDHSLLTLQKSLVVTRHVMIYGSEKTVNSALALQRGVQALLEYNTVLMAQKLQGAAAFMHRLKGGSVDMGYPVREAAQKVYPLMIDTNKLRELRNSSADPNSLVPVGSDKVGFVSDDVRHFMLKKRIEEQYKLQTKSNLVKEAGGFGAGYASKDGKNVVGAAHGLEEMIKQAEIANRKFTDTGDSGGYNLPKLSDFADYTAPSMPSTAATNDSSNNNTQDLLFGANANPQQGTTAVADLLDFSAQPSQPPPVADLLGGMDMSAGGTGDLLGTTATSDIISISMHPSPAPAGGLLDFGATGGAPTSGTVDPFASVSGSLETTNYTVGGITKSLLTLEITGDATNVQETPQSTEPVPAPAMAMAMAPDGNTKANVMGSSAMSSNSDRFSALDSLEVPVAAKGSSILPAREAENRLLSQSATSTTAPTPPTSYGDPNIPPFAISTSTGPLAMEGPASSEFTNNMSLTATMPGSSTCMGLGVDPVGHSAVGSGLKVAQSVAPLKLSSSWGADGDSGGDDDGFVMGGPMGAGLEPLGPAPAAPPPPPPPPS